MAGRIQSLDHWLRATVGLREFSLEPASGDASFRRYFRVRFDNGSLIAMDAPPEKEDCRPFVTIARQFREIGLNVPAIHAEDLQQGFLLLEDLGATLYLDVLDEESADRLYGDALNALSVIQARGPCQGVPPYDRRLLMQEMELFRVWLVGKHLGLVLTTDEEEMLRRCFEVLVLSALEQPQVCVHRDYHSRNLMATEPNPGILDFQDAVVGPVTYDLVSLLRDCYIRWPVGRVEPWARDYFSLAVSSGILAARHEKPFLRWFDLMGVQRHLKAAGIFARLYRRDGKPGYLKEVPRTLGYIQAVSPRYPELEGLGTFLERRILPGFRSM